MSLENKISVQVESTSLERVFAAIDVIKTELPFLLNLKIEDRKMLPKMGDKTVSFVQKSLEYAKQNPSIVPTFLDVTEFQKDVNLVNSLLKIVLPINQLREQLDDTSMLAGSEAYAAALAFYNASKAAAKAGVPGMKSIIEDLSTRFPGRGTNTTATTLN